MKVTRRGMVMAVVAGAALKAEALADYERIVSHGQFRGKVEAEQVDALLHSEKVSREQLMMKLLPLAQRRAHPPLSHYFVGAVALGTSGSLYLGQNIEIPGNMLGLAVHAEQSAIANAYMSGEPGVTAMAVTAAPCGHCRQFLSEVSLEMSILMPDLPAMTLSELLPRAFGPRDLKMTDGAFPVQKKLLALASDRKDDLLAAAWEAACSAYSPYTKSPSGVALATANGRIFAGSYIENAAFNPSLPPLETALAGYFAAGSGAGEIQRAVLVESPRGGVSQQVTTRSVLAAIAPSATFERVLLRS